MTPLKKRGNVQKISRRTYVLHASIQANFMPTIEHWDSPRKRAQ